MKNNEPTNEILYFVTTFPIHRLILNENENVKNDPKKKLSFVF